jgi:hypothetical protein
MQTLPLAMVVGYGDPGETALQGVQFGSPSCVCLGPWSRKPSGLSRNRGVRGVPVLATLLGHIQRRARFVRDQEFRLAGQRNRDSHAPGRRRTERPGRLMRSRTSTT